LVEIYTEGDSEPYLLRLHAFKPGPDIQFEPMVNFKYISVGQERTETIIFKNEGKQSGYVSLREDPPNKLGCKIEPANFSIDPDEYVRVSITLAGDRADIIKRQIAVTT
jgi:hypothetical protein